MDELYEDRPCGITGLTYDGFKQISSDADVVRFRESAMVGGEPNVLAYKTTPNWWSKGRSPLSTGSRGWRSANP